KVSHRDFTTGFYLGKPGGSEQNYGTSNYIKDYAFLGLVKEYDPETGLATVEQRNKMVIGDRVEIFGPGADFFEQELTEMYDEEGQPIDAAPHAQQIVKIRMKQPVGPFFMIRKKL
ncbi:MAG: U32 family peptidase C-terminal domain-containing protein, partial [Firmicutes bacterium]|nr:U32 family peptidase C-terminal domain-containing protein [Bacillota bacterium]